MNEDQLNDVLDQAIPEPDQNARKIAINSALSEFSQAFDESARPIDNRDTWLSKLTNAVRSFFMTTPASPRISNTFATIAVAFVAVSIFLLLPKQEQTPAELLGSPAQPPETAVLDDAEADPASQATQPSPIAADSESESQTGQAMSNANPASPPVMEAPVGILREQEQAALASEVRQNRLVKKSAKVTADKHNSSASVLRGLTLADAVAPSPSASAPVSMSYHEPRITAPVRPDLGEEYAEYHSNTIKLVAEDPISTFSADVDTAAYSLVRDQLTRGYLPAPQAVRAEELINYFDYQYEIPRSTRQPFKPTVTVLTSPWNTDKKLIHIGIKGYDLISSEQPDSNIVFLLDVSGSMSAANKLPLVKQSIGLLLDTLKPSDTVSIAVYAGAAGTVLAPTEVANKSKILAALERLNAGGSTAGGAGIELAYQLAEQNFNKNAVNRIVLATDGDFNVGMQSNTALKTLVERKREQGIFLSVLGFGRNNYQDDMMQTLAQNGNGVAAYIDTLAEAKKVLVDEATSTLFTIAKDVKFQVEFNPTTVSDYRLVGYETRALNREDFNNDKVDAGDIGAGHTVTAIYEITPVGVESKSIDEPRYTQNKVPSATNGKSNEYGFLKIRYKLPNGSKSKLLETPIPKRSQKISPEVEFSTAVAGFAQLLTGGKYTSDFGYDDVIKAAQKSKGADEFGYRSEFIQLVRMAKIAKP